MAWVFCRNHWLWWWCCLLVIFKLFSFLFPQNKISLREVYKINNYWREVRPKSSLLHKKYFNLIEFIHYIYFQYHRKQWWMVERALSRAGGNLPWLKNTFSWMVQVRKAFGIYSEQGCEGKKLGSALNDMTLQQKTQNLLMLEYRKTKSASAGGNRVGWTLIYLTFFSYVPSCVPMSGIGAQVSDVLSITWQLYHGPLFPLLFQYLSVL